jgi:hypothetical protein
MADVVGSVLAVNFVQGPDYLQDVAVAKAEAENAAARAKRSELEALAHANKSHQYANEAHEWADEAHRQADNAHEWADEAHDWANEAHTQADISHSWADTSKSWADNAFRSAEIAAEYADDAKESADDAQESANTANNQANNTASLVRRAENAVAGIWAMQAPAWDSTKVYSYPDVVSYVDGNTYRCIGVNVPAGTHPDKSPSWVRLSVLGADDYFDVDVHGDLMPGLNPTFAYDWQLDANGDIMPWAAID